MSIITDLLKPYKKLFKGSDKKPKEEKKEEKKEIEKPVTEEKDIIRPLEPRTGKILWKKKKK